MAAVCLGLCLGLCLSTACQCCREAGGNACNSTAAQPCFQPATHPATHPPALPPSPHAHVPQVRLAVANARNNAIIAGLEPSKLVVTRIFATRGTKFQRKPWFHGKGHMSVRRKPKAHLTVEVQEQEGAEPPRHWPHRGLLKEHRERLAAGGASYWQQQQQAAAALEGGQGAAGQQQQPPSKEAVYAATKHMFPLLARKGGPTQLVAPSMMRPRKERRFPRPALKLWSPA